MINNSSDSIKPREIMSLLNNEIKYFSKGIDVNICDANKIWKILRKIIGIGKSKPSNSHNFHIN